MDAEAIGNLCEHAHKASPAFGLGTAERDGRGSVEALGVRWGEQFALIPAPDEMELARWMCLLAIGDVAVSEDGMPVAAPISHLGYMDLLVFSGAGVVFLTSRRFIGILMQAEGVLGPVDGSGQQILAFSLPLNDVTTLILHRKSGFLGPKETGVSLGTWAGGNLFVDAIDRLIDHRNNAQRQAKAESMRTIINAVAAVRGPRASEPEARLLTQAMAGHWLPVAELLMAPLVPSELPPGAGPDISASDSDEGDAEAACPWCGSQLRPGHRFCAACGGKVPEPARVCTVCGSELETDALFCGRCGSPAGEAAQ